MLKGPKDEGLALLKKCEEVARHLSSRGKDVDNKKRLDSRKQTDGCSSNWGSSAQFSLEQIDGLLGTNLADVCCTSDRYESESWLGTESSNVVCGRKANVTALSLPSCAKSVDNLALFIYKHGFQDLLSENTLSGQSTDSSTLARRRKSQEQLLKSGGIRILARLLKHIHDSNFYRSPQDKIANAFGISIQKHRIDREGLSADWEFYGAHYHPKIPPKDKITYVQISHELFRRAIKRSTILPSNSKISARSSGSGEIKHAARVNKSKTSEKAKSPSPSKHGKCGNSNNSTIKRKGSRSRLRGTSKNSEVPLEVRELAATLPTDLPHNSWECSATLSTENEDGIERRPPSNLGSIPGQINRETKDMGDSPTEIVRKRPTTASKSQTTPGSDDHNVGRRGQRAGSPKIRSKFMLQNSAADLPSCIMSSVKDHFLKCEPDEGLSILARIEQLFPMSHTEEISHRRAELEVEIERLKILRW